MKTVDADPSGLLTNDTLLFESTGRTVYAHDCSISLAPDGRSIGYGSDGGWPVEFFTKEERLELADAMIGIWVRFKEAS